MRRTRGRFRYINAFIASRNWSFLADDKALVSYMGLLRFIILAILSWPALTLSAWFIALLVPIIRDDEDNKEYLRPVGVLLLSVFILFMITSGLLIRW